MKTIFSIFLTVISFYLHGQPLGVMSYNIRYANENDGPDHWDQRKEKIVSMLNFYEPTIFGIQEGLLEQVQYLDRALTRYEYAGAGRDNGGEKGEFCAIFYDTTRYRLLDQQTFWLSETPEQVSIGWDASMERICTWVHLKEKQNDRGMWVFNTHLDHKGASSRAYAISLIMQRMDALTLDSDDPVLLFGDLNMEPDEPAARAMGIKLQDTRTTSRSKAYGPEGTFNGFDHLAELNKRIDYIFVKGMRVLKQAHIDDQTNDHRYPSDHFPVFAELMMND